MQWQHLTVLLCNVVVCDWWVQTQKKKNQMLVHHHGNRTGSLVLIQTCCLLSVSGPDSQSCDRTIYLDHTSSVECVCEDRYGNANLYSNIDRNVSKSVYISMDINDATGQYSLLLCALIILFNKKAKKLLKKRLFFFLLTNSCLQRRRQSIVLTIMTQ